MSRIYFLTMWVLVIAILTACSEGRVNNNSNKPLPAENQPLMTTSEQDAQSSENNGESETQKTDWTAYKIDKKDTFKKVKFTISDVAVTDNYQNTNEDGETSAVSIKIKIENTSENEVYNTYPDQMTLVTSTGEQINNPVYTNNTNRLGGKIHEGVVKNGMVTWALQKGNVDEIVWVKLQWKSDEMVGSNEDISRDSFKTHSMKIVLPKY
ncbi:hypothetical protein GLW08_10560 [Pontibacillus yanchengensis]|uniref:Uncharacterized protein n=2 Tax=Pontibacillus yanchengensis TaxID=462910 RepID=A0ACC7VG74_9BACI|nr:hypothetical protein [Pontibacillus yanchengensis]MYL34310.1 hypothetical protein [Pontibacillus yanchengensis]MYL53778.1 hypothetical protein [Pontibacillus yanchengensis]